MVPGITERERLASEARRRDWLAGANPGATRGTPAAVHDRSALRHRVWTPRTPRPRTIPSLPDLRVACARVRRLVAGFIGTPRRTILDP